MIKQIYFVFEMLVIVCVLSSAVIGDLSENSCTLYNEHIVHASKCWNLVQELTLDFH